MENFFAGYRKAIPKQIIDLVESGKTLFKQALTLKQIANFYNTMNSQIIESQRPMIVEQAIQFEAVVKNLPEQMKSSSKKNEGEEFQQQLDDYISLVQNQANNIMKEIRKLRRLHMTLIDQVNDLFETDFAKNKNVWKEKMEKIKMTIEFGSKGRDPSLCKIWRTHWDYQIYKAFECQYQKVLLNWSTSSSEIQTDLVIYRKSIAYKPNIEEIKQKYLQDVRAFVTYPVKNFSGIGGDPEIYKQMPVRNCSVVERVYEKAEEIFDKLLE